jgi:hypothetical protein
MTLANVRIDCGACGSPIEWVMGLPSEALPDGRRKVQTFMATTESLHDHLRRSPRCAPPSVLPNAYPVCEAFYPAFMRTVPAERATR